MIFICMTNEVVWQCDTPSQVGRLQKYNTLSHSLFNTYIFKAGVINLLYSIKICRLPIFKKSYIFAICKTLYNSINFFALARSSIGGLHACDQTPSNYAFEKSG